MTKTLEQTINSVREKTSYADRQAALYRLFTEISLRRFVLSASERELMQTYLFSDLETLYERIDGEPSYRKKNEIAEFAKKLIFVISKVFPKPEVIAEKHRDEIMRLLHQIRREQELEIRAKETVCGNDVCESDVRMLLDLLRERADEEVLAAVLAVLAKEGEALARLNVGSQLLLGEFLHDAFARILDSVEPLTDVREETLCLLCECLSRLKFVDAEATAKLLRGASFLTVPRVTFAAVKALCELGFADRVPHTAVFDAAYDPRFTSRIGRLCMKYGIEDLFPESMLTEQKLAQSDFVSYLASESVLAAVPDEIGELGEVTVKREVYHVYRFRSESGRLMSEERGKWLIGAISCKAVPYPAFDLYEAYEKPTEKETLAYIGKRFLRK